VVKIKLVIGKLRAQQCDSHQASCWGKAGMDGIAAENGDGCLNVEIVFRRIGPRVRVDGWLTGAAWALWHPICNLQWTQLTHPGFSAVPPED